MDARREKAEAIAKQYMRSRTLLKELGSGAEGYVFPTTQATAVKVFTYPEKFENELAAYQRLHDCDVYDILGVAVPRLIDFDRQLLVIEMTIVEPPFLLDFAQATIDEPHDFPPEVEDQWWADKEEEFGEQFSLARDVYYALQRIAGIYYYDLAPRNLNLTNR